ncbi:salivary peroxidase/catechol oxidase-like [Littorina saxatilis]|uniref:Peroxidase n=1 Tax=Littorina saxatilis TaxID=31220 RepID=A0AAN9AW91_9CAEN
MILTVVLALLSCNAVAMPQELSGVAGFPDPGFFDPFPQQPQIKAGTFMYTHPELCLPLTSRLIGTAKPVSIEPNITRSSRFRRQASVPSSVSGLSSLSAESSSLLSSSLQSPELSREAAAEFGPLSQQDTLGLQSAIDQGTQLLGSLQQGQELPTPDSSSDAFGSSFSSLSGSSLSGSSLSGSSLSSFSGQSSFGSGSSFGSSSFLYSLYPCGSFVNLLFRTADGSCNHRNNYGQSLKALNRLIPAVYNDGAGEPRKYSVLGSSTALPSARTVSRKVHTDKVASTQLTVLVMLWGQFMDHDMASSPLPIADPQDNVPCCGPNGAAPTGPTDRECFPIRFPPGDPKFLGTCMEFVRSAPVTSRSGNIVVPRENKNVITAFIDGSTVYGSTEHQQDELRDPNNRHLLRTTSDNFPPSSGLDDCVRRNANDICFLAGDERVNENPGLTLLHTVFLRYHNYIARQLKAISPFRSRELIFQQARAIVIAVIQNIMFSDWLPIILGPSIRSQYKLDISANARTSYDRFEDPRIFQGFSTAAFRFGHSLIPRTLLMAPGRRVPLRKLFFTPFETRENLDTLTAGILQAADSEVSAQPVDRHLVEEVTGHLFENQEGEGRAFDLAALNIHRGRDHGLPSYNDFRQKLGLGRVTSFADSKLGSSTSRNALDDAYDHVNDIDLFTGGTSEPAFDGGLVGETFSHLIGRQMHRLKFGDRFFFDSRRFYFHGFNDQQLTLLRGIHFSHVLCLTTGVSSVQQNVFNVAGTGNPSQPCSLLRSRHPSLSRFRYYPFF